MYSNFGEFEREGRCFSIQTAAVMVVSEEFEGRMIGNLSKSRIQNFSMKGG
jgi:hypothetical protein